MKCKSRFFFLGAVLTALVIFIFSSFNGDESVKQSNAIREPLVKSLSEVYSVETTTVGAKGENYTEITTLSQNLKSKNTLTRRQWSKVLKYSAEVIRKIAHMFLYFILTIFLLLGFNSLDKMWKKYSVLLALACCFLYGATDEIHQIFTGRTARVTDVFIDLLGGIIAVIILYIIKSIKKMTD